MKKIFLLIFSILIILPAYSQGKNTKNKEKVKKENKRKSELPDGYGTLKWGTSLSDAKKGISGKIFYTDDKKVIISREGDLEYKYGFFYDNTSVEGKLFYLSMSFPYLSLESVKEKIESKYGQPSSENIKDNKGEIAWDSEKTIIILWVDNYEKKPYSRRITYIGKKIAKEMNEFQKKVFNKTEIELINKLNP